MRLILGNSLRKAIEQQNLERLITELERIVPDLSDQYSTIKVDTEFTRTNVRGLHAFQISLVNSVIDHFKKPMIADIGDSAGTHLQYILGLHAKGREIKCLSVNLDKEAIEKIKKKGLNAIQARAEDLHRHGVDADIFLCFEVLEHLMNPFQFLHALSEKTSARYLIITVPYMERSRVGLHHIRRNVHETVNAENTHIFEFCPEDWKIIIKHSGWDIVKDRIYLQYPKAGFLRITKPLWKKYDFEGFLGLILKKDNTWSSQYNDWE